MKTINIYVEKAQDGTYWGSSTNIPGVVSAFGSSLEELKKNFEQAFNDYIEVAKDLQEDWVSEFYTPVFEYQMDLQGFFSLVSTVNLSST
jgi:predicted RNase H-like HicB family nuclease